MNFRLVFWFLGIVCLLIGGTMITSLPWAFPSWGVRNEPSITVSGEFEWRGFLALLLSIVICGAVGGTMLYWGRHRRGALFRKEAMAVVGLSWIMATMLGAAPFLLSGTYRGPALRMNDGADQPAVFDDTWFGWGRWLVLPSVTDKEISLLDALLENQAKGQPAEFLAQFDRQWLEDHPVDGDATPSPEILRQLAQHEPWDRILLFPGDPGPEDRQQNFRVKFVRMSVVDALFESQSGFSTTGATVISDLEDPYLVPHCILFWRSMTHFLGGLGIIVLFVVILGQGSAGKALLRAELPGPSPDSSQPRVQHAAWTFAAIYVVLNVVLTLLLKMNGLTWFDSLCHAFGTMATGGFSTYNKSLGHFNSATIDYIVVLFMLLAGSNFSLLYLAFRLRPGAMFRDLEWRTYISIILVATGLVVAFGLYHGDFRTGESASVSSWTEWSNAARFGLFQVASIMTTTGYGTHDFDAWNNFGRAALLMLMFVGGCAGSTGGGLKVIRHVLFFKILRLEIEHAFHPSVVRPLRIGGRPVEDPTLRHSILVYFGFVLVLMVLCWLFVLIIEPDATWAGDPDHKLIDTASAIAATLNNIGPGLGTVGATQNYGHFSWPAKTLFTWLMMLGRVEVFVILCLFVPRFWRSA